MNIESGAESLTAEAVALKATLARLSVEHSAASEAFLGDFQSTGYTFEQIVGVLSRKGKGALLNEIELRLESGIRAVAANRDPFHADTTAARKSLVADVLAIWNKRSA